MSPLVTALTDQGGGAVYMGLYPGKLKPVIPDRSDSALGQRGAVLVVDDEERVRHLIARALTGAGYEVLEAADGTQALALLESLGDRLRLAIIDVVMPGVTGRELAATAQDRWPRLPIIFISGYPLSYLEERDLFDPGIPLLKKPFLPSLLLERVEDLLRRGPVSAG